MKGSVVGLGAVAVILAGGTGLLLVNYMDKVENTPALTAPPPPAPKLAVLVATADVDVGSVVDSSLGWQEWPEDNGETVSDHGGVVAKDDAAKEEALKKMKGGIARVPLLKGLPITESMVAHVESGSTLSAILSPGMRSVTVSVDLATGVGGMVQPGDRVDVLLSTDLPDRDAGTVDPISGQQRPRFVTETILRDLKVLTADRRVVSNAPKPGDSAPAPAAGSAEPPPPTTVTLEATPRQVEKLVTASRMGKLTLTMVPMNRTKEEAGRRVPTTDTMVMPGLRAAREGAPVSEYEALNPFDEPKASSVVTIYKWTAPTTVTLTRPDKKGGAPAAEQPGGALGRAKQVLGGAKEAIGGAEKVIGGVQQMTGDTARTGNRAESPEGKK